MALKRKAYRGDDELDMTPMIDCTFLLLIFFMVTSKMDDQSKLSLPPSGNGLGVDAKNAINVSMYRSDGEPEIFITTHTATLGVSSSAEAGPLSLSELTELAKEQIAEGRRNVIIKADRDMTSGSVEEVARAVAEADPNTGGEEGLQFFVGVTDKPRP